VFYGIVMATVRSARGVYVELPPDKLLSRMKENSANMALLTSTFLRNTYT